MERWNEIWILYTKNTTLFSFAKSLLWDWENSFEYLALYYLFTLVSYGLAFYLIAYGHDNYYFFMFVTSTIASVIVFNKLKKEKYNNQFCDEKHKKIEMQYGEFQLASRFQMFSKQMNDFKFNDVSKYIDICQSEIERNYNKLYVAKTVISALFAVGIGVVIGKLKLVELPELNVISIFMYVLFVSLIYVLIYTPLTLIQTRSERLRQLNLFLHLYQLDFCADESVPVKRRIKRNMLK